MCECWIKAVVGDGKKKKIISLLGCLQVSSCKKSERKVYIIKRRQFRQVQRIFRWFLDALAVFQRPVKPILWLWGNEFPMITLKMIFKLRQCFTFSAPKANKPKSSKMNFCREASFLLDILLQSYAIYGIVQMLVDVYVGWRSKTARFKFHLLDLSIPSHGQAKYDLSRLRFRVVGGSSRLDEKRSAEKIFLKFEDYMKTRKTRESTI